MQLVIKHVPLMSSLGAEARWGSFDGGKRLAYITFQLREAAPTNREELPTWLVRLRQQVKDAEHSLEMVETEWHTFFMPELRFYKGRYSPHSLYRFLRETRKCLQRGWSQCQQLAGEITDNLSPLDNNGAPSESPLSVCSSELELFDPASRIEHESNHNQGSRICETSEGMPLNAPTCSSNNLFD